MDDRARLTETREYAVARSVRARLLGTFLAVIGVLVLVLTVVSVAAHVSAGVVLVLGLTVVAAVGLVVLIGGRRWWVVRLDDTGYRVRFVRGVGRAQARWTDVEDLATTHVSGSPCVVLRLRDGGTSTVPVDLIEGDREEFVDELRRRLDAGHGYRRR